MSFAFLEWPVSKFTNPKLVTVASNLTVHDAAKVMIESKLDSVLVFEHSQIIGIITENDMLRDVIAKGLDPRKTSVKQICKSPLLTIKKNAKVREALELMKKNNVRRLVVIDKQPIGLITQKMLCGNMKEEYFVLPELETPSRYHCPYCSSYFEDKKILSKHIDNIHIGRGLLEGNLRKFER